MSFQLDPNNNAPQGNNQPQQAGRTGGKSPIARLLNPATILGVILFLVGGYFMIFVEMTLSSDFFTLGTFLYLGRIALVLLGVYFIVVGRNKAAREGRSAASQF